MKLDNFRLLVNDFAASFQFWHEIIGLSVIYQDEHSTYAYFDAGAARLELLRADYFAKSFGGAAPVQHENQDHRGVITFQADDVDATYAELVKRGAPSLAVPMNHPAGFARLALLSAPDGYVVEVFQSRSAMPKAHQ